MCCDDFMIREINRFGLFALLLALAFIRPCYSWAGLFSFEKAPAVGTQAPDFTLESQSGKPISLHDFRGQWVVLYFYPKDFTSGCTIEAHQFQADLSKYKLDNAVILGVSVQSPKSHKAFCAKEGMSFRLLSDATSKISLMYGSLINLGFIKLSKRHTFIIDPKGIIQKEFLDVSPATHSRQVLAALKKLQLPVASSLKESKS
jgi:peroxiredoxin Q/BCP